jgi:hypothetical protein
MPVFISYSHENEDFVNKLAAHLIKAKANVWIDQWELHVGDSLIAKIQTAIHHASSLIVILSKASVASEWCKKELNAGLIRELEEKRVVVLPLLLDDCELPLFLRDKVYADFRTNFDKGLNQVLESIARVTSDKLGRIEEPEWHIDWAIDWYEIKNRFCLRLTLIEQAEEKPYSVLSEILMVANDVLTFRYKQYAEAGLEHLGRQVLLEMLRGSEKFRDYQVLITDNLSQNRKIEAYDAKTGAGLQIDISCRRLGEDTGRDIFLHLGKQVTGIIKNIGQNMRPATREEWEKLQKILST